MEKHRVTGMEGGEEREVTGRLHERIQWQHRWINEGCVRALVFSCVSHYGRFACYWRIIYPYDTTTDKLTVFHAISLINKNFNVQSSAKAAVAPTTTTFLQPQFADKAASWGTRCRGCRGHRLPQEGSADRPSSGRGWESLPHLSLFNYLVWWKRRMARERWREEKKKKYRADTLPRKEGD